MKRWLAGLIHNLNERELIFYCKHENLEPKQPFCPWDGIVNGKLVPVGTYVAVVKLTSREQNITQTETKSITIIQ
jgi:hypothetical protein